MTENEHLRQTLSLGDLSNKNRRTPIRAEIFRQPRITSLRAKNLAIYGKTAADLHEFGGDAERQKNGANH